MTRITRMTLGELISTMYEEFLDLYEDEELAAVAAASVINDLLASSDEEEELEQTRAAA